MPKSRRHSFPSLWGTVQPEAFAKTAALLRQLNATPALPAENSIEEFVARLPNQGERSMTVEKERDLAAYLAFLSALTQDPYKVTALCVEENSDASCMTIRLAANSGDLSKVKEGLESIAEVLMQVANERHINLGKIDSTALLLQRIVVVNRSRILSRLRSRHSARGAKGKPPIVPRLYDAVCGSPASKALQEISADELALLQGHVIRLQKVYTKIEEHHDEKLLVELVKCAYEASNQRSLQVLLEYSAMHRDEQESLHRAARKLGRYYSASRFLILAARKLSIFRKIRVDTIAPPSQKAPADNTKIPIGDLLDSLFSRLPNDQRQTMITSAYAILKRRGVDADAAVSKSLSHKYRVHAEIQLLVHYASNKDAGFLQPRVICGSKSACFLCNLFLKFYGQFYTPKTHGRLYEKWAMPENNGVVSGAFAQKFGRTLEQIQGVLTEEIRKVLMLGGMSVNHPNESILAPSARWSSPSRSVAGYQGNGATSSSVGDTTPEVSPFLESDQSYGFSRQSSRTSVKTLAAAAFGQTLQILAATTGPGVPAGKPTEVLPLSKLITQSPGGSSKPDVKPGLGLEAPFNATGQDTIVGKPPEDLSLPKSTTQPLSGPNGATTQPELEVPARASATELVATVNNSARALPLPESAAQPLDGPSGSATRPVHDDLPSRSGLADASLMAKAGSVVIENNTPPVSGLPRLTVNAGKPALPGALTIDDSAGHGLRTPPIVTADAILGGKTLDTQPTPTVPPATTLGGDGSAPGVEPTLPLGPIPHAPQLPRSLPPLIPLSVPKTGLVETPIHLPQEASLLPPTPPTTAQPPASLPTPPTTAQSQTPQSTPPTTAQPPASAPTTRPPLLLHRGTPIRHALHPSQPPLLVHTPRIHTTLSSETPCSVLIKYLLPTERPRLSQLGENIVNVKLVGFGQERTAAYGAASQAASLYLRNKGDLVEVKYEVGGSNGREEVKG
ncbi:MAG: hypothetical protein M1839_002741 [Geoglossum umbratile]|nr:MAG: hypothetical protein M1839_002741 [Geoglossum umbratile]